MKKFRYALYVLAMTMLAFTFVSPLRAQASRTWVSGVGDDANPCSRSAPCKTFAGAISKTAPGGEIDALDPAGYGAVTITKAITIDGGEGQVAGVLVSGGNAIVVAAGNSDVVTLRNLDINGLNAGTNGIQINSAKSVHIEHCQIYGFLQHGINDNLNSAQGSLANLFVNDCAIRANATGIAVSSSLTTTEAFIDNCRIQGNTGFGISASNGNAIAVAHCNASQNGGEAVKIDTNASAFITSCVLNGNLTGALNSGGLSMQLMDTTILFNGTGVSGTVTTFGNNNVRSNSGGNTLPAPVGQQ